MNLTGLTAVPLAEILQSPQQRLLAYPDERVGCDRISELSDLGITAIYDWGPKQIQGWHCLGLGYCGLVLLAQHQDQQIALKVRRADASRPSFAQEASMLTLANTHQVGPQLLGSSPNFLLMDHVVGQPLLVWLQSFQALTHTTLQSQLTQLLWQAFQLDQASLDHGNLRCVTAHSIVTTQGPVLLDFSSASTTRRPANVTSLTQGLFWGTTVASLLVPHWFHPDQQHCIERLRHYKHHPTSENFQRLLDLLFDP
ncbi:serine/threonine protein kinase [Acaryochloris sp. CCMEE 5410]|uniref:serine/threonine protein kinase n=1 Tax=Acaryochloris sp. CCMEE 5410 TaxID=310037 RepID=UPI0002484A40|nr:serine/threonine protein kinase [Acaryochloris sp. CCMEE 5410]KAI9131694.1 serine/threonine protein kinase [Acaryochloris sp. CCMEE 5410]